MRPISWLMVTLMSAGCSQGFTVFKAEQTSQAPTDVPMPDVPPTTPQCPTTQSLHVSDFGALANGETDATEAVRKALDCALKAKVRPVEVVFGAGTYRFKCEGRENKSCLSILGAAQGLTVRGQGSSSTHLLMDNPDVGLIYAEKVTALKIAGFSVDYSLAPFVQGRITAVMPSHFEFQVLPGGMSGIPAALCAAYGQGQDSVDASAGLGHYPGTSFGMIMDPTHGQWIKRHNFPGGAILPTACRQLSATTWRIDLPAGVAAHIEIGDHYVHLVGRHHTKSAVYVHACTNVEVKDVTVHASPGLATLFTQNHGSILIDGLAVRFPTGSNRFVTTNADGVHLQHNWATPVIENSYFEGMADDAINNYAVANSVSAMDGSDLEVRTVREVRVGDKIEVMASTTGLVRGVATVLALNPGRGAGFARLTLNAAIPGVQTDDLVFDISAAGPGAKYQSNTFGRHRGRAIVSHSEGSLIARNLFRDIHWTAVQLTPDLNYREGPTARQVLIQDNHLFGGDLPFMGQIDARGVATQASGPEQITIENNRFTAMPGAAIHLSAVQAAHLTHNQIFATNCPRPDTFGMNIVASVGVVISGTLQACTMPSASATEDHNFGSDGAGSVDAISAQGLASGWAMDLTASAESVTVQFYRGGPIGFGTPIGATLANLASPDLLSVAPGPHRFQYQLPASPRGWHVLYAYASRFVPNSALGPIPLTPRGILFLVK